ncbi:minor capsid protein [Capybara microvirus Cap1_SP_158]|nr:minor capsid protein [Capybara microvirus Cap1_SP_158]
MKKNTFRTFSFVPSITKRNINDSGKPERVRYGYTYKNGEYVFEALEVVPVYEMIQAEREGCELRNIIDRYEGTLTKNVDNIESFFADTTVFPSNIFELTDAAYQAKQRFTELPADVQLHFGSSANFYKQFGSPEFDKYFEDYKAEKINQFYGISQSVKSVEPVQASEIQKGVRNDFEQKSE